jgi:hypothetical protein
MKTMVRVLGALAMLAGVGVAAPAARADEPCDPPAQTYVEPGYETYAPQYAPQYAPAPVVVQPDYRESWRERMWEARRAELRRERFEAYRRWWMHHRFGYGRGYGYGRY